MWKTLSLEGVVEADVAGEEAAGEVAEAPAEGHAVASHGAVGEKGYARIAFQTVCKADVSSVGHGCGGGCDAAVAGGGSRVVDYGDGEEAASESGATAVKNENTVLGGGEGCPDSEVGVVTQSSGGGTPEGCLKRGYVVPFWHSLREVGLLCWIVDILAAVTECGDINVRVLLEAVNHGFQSAGQVAQVIVGDKAVGSAGEVHAGIAVVAQPGRRQDMYFHIVAPKCFGDSAPGRGLPRQDVVDPTDHGQTHVGHALQPVIAMGSNEHVKFPVIFLPVGCHSRVFQKSIKRAATASTSLCLMTNSRLRGARSLKRCGLLTASAMSR